MEDFELVGPNGTDVNNEFLKQYRDALKNQYDASLSSLRQQYRNNQASIMSAANERGMMYSNFPQRSKIQAETDYLTNASKLHSTYQTGLDKLRNNAVNAYNQIKAYEEAIKDLEEKAAGGSGSGSSSGTSGASGTNGNVTDNTTGNTGALDPSMAGYTPMNSGTKKSTQSSNGFWDVTKDAYGVGANQTWQDRAGAAVGRALGGVVSSQMPWLGPIGNVALEYLGGAIGGRGL